MSVRRKQIVTGIPYAAVDIKFFLFCYSLPAFIVFTICGKFHVVSQIFVQLVEFKIKL